MHCDANVVLQSLRFDQDEGALSLFGAIEAFHNVWLKRADDESVDCDRPVEAYARLIRATETPEARRSLNILIKPRGYPRRFLGRRSTLVATAQRLEPDGYGLLGRPDSALTHAELWSRYGNYVGSTARHESLVIANRTFILLHRLVSEAEMYEADPELIGQHAAALRSLGDLLYEALRDVVRQHVEDWDLHRACSVATRLLEPWVGRYVAKRIAFGPQTIVLRLCENMALAKRHEEAWRLFNGLQEYRRFDANSNNDRDFDATERVLREGRTRRPQGATVLAVDNLLTLGLITEAAAAKQQERVLAKAQARAEDWQRKVETRANLRIVAVASGVPHCESGSDWTEKHQVFYETFAAALRRGESPPLFGNNYFVHKFAQETVQGTPRAQQPALIGLFAQLANSYGEAGGLCNLVKSYLNLLTLHGRHQDVLVASRKWSTAKSDFIDVQLDAFRRMAIPVPGSLLLAQGHFKVDSYSRANPARFEHHMEAVVCQDGAWNEYLFADPQPNEWETSEVFEGFVDYGFVEYDASRYLTITTFWPFDRLRRLHPRINALAREAMNRVRDDLGVPRIGEGWVSETEVFRALQAAFPAQRVIQHGRPAWLSPQHLDVWMPDAHVGVEYHGRQHFEPVEFFGGDEALQQTLLRDERKRMLCEDNALQLFAITETGEIPALVEAIRKRVAPSNHNGGTMTRSTGQAP